MGKKKKSTKTDRPNDELDLDAWIAEPATPPQPGDRRRARIEIDQWIAAVKRAERTIELYPYEDRFAADAAAIEAQIDEADEVTAQRLLDELAALRAERAESTITVHMRQLTQMDTIAAAVAVPEGTPEHLVGLWAVAAACVEPQWTGEQLVRLFERDATGERMVGRLAMALNELQAADPVAAA